MSPAFSSEMDYRPCMIVATGGFAQPPGVWLRLRRLGWDVYPARSGPEVRRLARMLEPDLVVLDTDLEGESGWLTCAKLVQDRPGENVVLLADDDGPRNRSRAGFVGASVVVPRHHDLVPLLHPSRFREGRLVGAA